MQYDPIKDVIGSAAKKAPVLRKIFYFTLGVMFLRTWHVKRALRQLLAGKKESFELFDAGSGFGQYSYFLARKFPLVKIHAIDVKKDYIEDCKQFFKQGGITNVNFDVEDLTVPKHNNRFDFILSVDVMEHIPEDVQVFKNFYAALKANGSVLINTPSNLGGSDADSESSESFIGEHARNGYGADEITEKLTSAGFSSVSVQYTYGTFGNIAWRFGIKYPMLMLNKSKAFFLIIPFYYLLTLWFTLIMMWLDYNSNNKTGTGLLVTAVKK